MKITQSIDYQSLWQPSATINTLKQRADLYKTIRQFFNERQYLEVETPIMAHFGGTDVYLKNIEARFRDVVYYLQTSPEYHMKRLLAAGSGPIFQLARVFRDDEAGRWHNPEFTMLEWYQLGINHHELMNEVDQLLQTILTCPPLRKKTYREAFLEVCEIDPFTSSIADLQACLAHFGLDNILSVDEKDSDQYLFLLMSHIVEPAFKTQEAPIAIYDFPTSQAALAIVNNNVAERFEVYYQGIELANGFHELCDPREQAVRFEQDLLKRQALGLSLPMTDQFFLQALSHGLPSCSGIALGVDRLLALKLHQTNIAETISFSFDRA